MESIVSVLAVITVCSAFPNMNHLDNPGLDKQYHQALEAALADFSQSLYVELAQSSADDDNFVFSPLSLHSALSLLYLGTRDNSSTMQQLGAAMGIVNNPQLLRQSYQ